MEYIVDLQGFRKSNSFVLKEAAYVPVGGEDSPSVLLFKPPCMWSNLTDEDQRANLWLEMNYHGVPWESGDIPYYHMIDVLQNSLDKALKVYVKGLEKKKWLQEILHGVNVCDLEDLGCQSLQQLNKDNIISCDYHTQCRFPLCAEKNVEVLRNWLLQQQHEALQDDYDIEDTLPLTQY